MAWRCEDVRTRRRNDAETRGREDTKTWVHRDMRTRRCEGVEMQHHARGQMCADCA